MATRVETERTRPSAGPAAPSRAHPVELDRQARNPHLALRRDPLPALLEWPCSRSSRFRTRTRTTSGRTTSTSAPTDGAHRDRHAAPEHPEQRRPHDRDHADHDDDRGARRLRARPPADPRQGARAGILVASLFVPSRVTGLISIWEIQERLGLINSTWGLLLPYQTLALAVSVFIMRGVFETIPRELPSPRASTAPARS